MIHISQIVIHVLDGVIRGFMYHDAYFYKMVHSVFHFNASQHWYDTHSYSLCKYLV